MLMHFEVLFKRFLRREAIRDLTTHLTCSFKLVQLQCPVALLQCMEPH